jgi:uncharacterized protein with HEPN domain
VSRDWLVYVDDIVECSRRVLEYTRGMSFEEFVADTRTYDAVLRNLEIIGEAAKQVPDEERLRHPTVPWSDMARFRDRLAHGYRALDPQLIWNVVQQRIPAVDRELRRILAEADGDAAP